MTAESRLQWIQAVRRLGATALVVALGACSGSGAGSAATGTLRVALTDAPSCGYDHVWVTIEKLRVHQNATAADADGGWTELALAPARRVDLTDLTNGVLEELGSLPLAVGSYSQARLVLGSNGATGAASLANAVQPTTGAVAALATPNAQQSGLELKTHFEIAAGQTADLLLDFDACKSVAKAGNSGNYELKPVVSVVPRVTSGIQGFLATTLSPSTTIIAAQQNGVTVRSTTPDASGKFSVPFLSTGTYSVVIMSEGHATAVVTDVPAGNNTVLNTAATAITTPLSSMADVTGTVAESSLSGSSTVSTPFTDAMIKALQPMTGGGSTELGHQWVNTVLGTYGFRLPAAAPVKAPYVSGGPLIFSPDTAAGGKYDIEVHLGTSGSAGPVTN
jgi:Domain of unknown function (DUF4382)/Carboxypeptidase regulatory-like domain